MPETQIDECYRLLPVEDELVLPPKYAALKEIFNCVEMEIGDLVCEKRMVLYSQIKYNVRRKTERRFTKLHLAMIKTIYPDAFHLRYEEVCHPCLTDYRHVGLVIDSSKSRCTNIYERERIFDTLLLNQAKFAHHDFLQTLDPPVFVPLDEMIRWHPLFDLNSVPNIVPEPIPLPTDNKSQLMTSFLSTMIQREATANERIEKSFASLMVKNVPPPPEYTPHSGPPSLAEKLNEILFPSLPLSSKRIMAASRTDQNNALVCITKS